MSKKVIVLIGAVMASLSFLAGVGCSNQNTEDIPEKYQHLGNLQVFDLQDYSKNTIIFEKEMVFRGGENDFLVRSGDIVVDSLGRVFISDMGHDCIHVFDKEGSYLTKIGQTGSGPGDFGYILDMNILGDRLYVFDQDLYRMSVFSLDSLNLLETFPVASNLIDIPSLSRAFKINQLFISSRGLFYAKFLTDSVAELADWETKSTKAGIYPIGIDGEIKGVPIIEKKYQTRVLLPISGARMVFPMDPIYGKGHFSVIGDNRIFFADPNAFLIKEYDAEGAYKQAFYYPVKEVPLTKESAIEGNFGRLYTENMENMELPPYWPVVTTLKTDPSGRMWVATSTEPMSTEKWWVLDSDGVPLAQFEWPRDEIILYVDEEHIYTRLWDYEELEYYRYRFDIGG